jgi:hypothetical protein
MYGFAQQFTIEGSMKPLQYTAIRASLLLAMLAIAMMTLSLLYIFV